MEIRITRYLYIRCARIDSKRWIILPTFELKLWKGDYNFRDDAWSFTFLWLRARIMLGFTPLKDSFYND